MASGDRVPTGDPDPVLLAGIDGGGLIGRRLDGAAERVCRVSMGKSIGVDNLLFRLLRWRLRVR